MSSRTKFVFLLLLATAMEPVRAGDLSDLAWMSGHWVGGGGAYEEVWLEPKAGSLPGSFRWVFPDGRQVLEYLVMEQTDDGVIFRFKHYDTNYEPWEKESPNSYRLESVDGQAARFARMTDVPGRVPKVIEYRREGNNLKFTGHSDDPNDDPLLLDFVLKN